VSGRPFLQVPGPTNVPERILRAMDRAVPDHRGPEMPALTAEIVSRLRGVFGTRDAEIVLYPGSGTAAWEASLANTLSPGDRVVALNIGHFSHLYAECARALGMVVDELDAEWGSGPPLGALEDVLRDDPEQAIRAVLMVHNETSTGVTSRIPVVRQVLDDVGHSALLLVDAVSSLASIEFQFDAWGVDVALTASQKGLMLPPGMGILAVSERALASSKRATTPRYFLDWQPALEQIHRGYFPYTPATLLLFGLREALQMLDEEGLDAVYTRHARLAEAVQTAVRQWNLEILCKDPDEQSNTTTTIEVPVDADADEVLRIAEQRYRLSLGVGLGKLKGRAFRIGHLGSLNELEVLATIAGVELALHGAGIAIKLGAGVAAGEHLFAAELAPKAVGATAS
jgi:alanine-glyoxylate transaminase / serine-glyoxylate transaminase / serine-pyruvate transaminase